MLTLADLLPCIVVHSDSLRVRSETSITMIKVDSTGNIGTKINCIFESLGSR